MSGTGIRKRESIENKTTMKKESIFFKIKASEYDPQVVHIYMGDELCTTILERHIQVLIELLNDFIGKSPFDFDEYTNQRNILIEQERYEEVIELDNKYQKSVELL